MKGCRYSSCDLVQVHLIQNLPQLQHPEQHGRRESVCQGRSVQRHPGVGSTAQLLTGTPTY